MRLVLLPLILFSACVAGPSGGGGGDPTTDVDHWNALSTQLDGRRSEFLGTHVQDLAAAGLRLYWLDTTNFDPSLASYDATTGDKLAYTFSLGHGDDGNDRASNRIVVTAEPQSDSVIYHAYDATSANAELGTTSTLKPAGAKWNAYATDGGLAYIMDTSTAGRTALLRWTPGQAPAEVTTLEAAGVAVGELEDFGVSGNTVVFIESGRIWKLDLATNHATWLMNHDEADGAVDFRSDGVLFTTAGGLAFYDTARGTLVDVSAKIDANPYQVNSTFASAAHYLQDFTRWRSYVIYIGQGGVFAYDLAHDTITPILLSPDRADLRVDYRYPVALDDGELFVTGLTSTDGAVGADGPTYKVDLKAILN